MFSVKTAKVQNHKFLQNEILLSILVLFANILISGTFYPLIYIFSAILHEFGHLGAMYLFGYQASNVKFMGFGIRIKNNQTFSYRQEIIISLMGPLINGIVFLVALMVSIFCKSEYLNQFMVSNLFYALINLFPLAPLDGYRIINSYICYKFSFLIAKRIKLISSIGAIAALLTVLIVLIYMNFLNISLIIIILILIFSSVFQIIIN